MTIAMPSMPLNLAYAIAAATALTALAGVALLGSGNLVGGLLALAAAAAIHRLVARDLATVVTAKEAAAAAAFLLLLCGAGDLVIGHPYLAVIFLIAAAALGFAFMLLQQGTLPEELRFGTVVACAAPGGLAHLRMLEELRDAGLLSSEEFAAKRLLLAV